MGRKTTFTILAIASGLAGLRLVKARLLEHETFQNADSEVADDTTSRTAYQSQPQSQFQPLSRPQPQSLHATHTERHAMRPDPEDPWEEVPQDAPDQVVWIAPEASDENAFRRKLHIPALTNKAPNPVTIQLIDIVPTLLGMLFAGIMGYWAGFIGIPGDADPTGALFGLYGIQATLIVSVAFLPKTLNQLTFGIIQLLVVITAIVGVAYAGFHFGWFGQEMGYVISIFLSLFCVAFSALSVTFAYSSRYWRATAHRREKKVLSNSTLRTRWRLRRANLMAYREWCWRHNEDPEKYEQQLWESGAFALTFSELEEARPSPALNDFLDSRQGIEAKDSLRSQRR